MEKLIQKLTPSIINNTKKDLKQQVNFIWYLFNLINNEIPHAKKYTQISFIKFVEIIYLEFPKSKGQGFIEKLYDRNDSCFEFDNGLIPICDNIFIYLKNEYGEESMEVLYSNNSDKRILDKIDKIALECFNSETPFGKIYLLSEHEGNFSLKDFILNDYNVDLNLNYNDDIIPFHEKTTNKLSKNNDKGLVILYGLPGTGKTTYLRNLTKLIRKRFIYVTPETAEIIASPHFLNFIMLFPNSILVIEDAESVLADRRQRANPVVTNLLNLSDGILSDCLHIQIICTFNIDISIIDKAFLRKGRLISKYNFGKLSANKVKILSQHLKHEMIMETESTLSEIYYQDDDLNIESEKKIGFNSYSTK